MRMRKHWIMVLIVLLIPGLLWSQEEPPTKPRRTSSRATPPGATPESARELRIFVLRYQQADQLARIIQVVIPPHEATIAVDGVSHKLIISASPDRMEKIGQVIEELDAGPVRQSDFPQMMYRIYMLEPPSKHMGLRPFSIMVTGSSQLPPDRVLAVGNGNDVQIESFHQAAMGEERWQFAIAGRAASYEPIERLTKSISDCQIMELEWEDDTPVMPTTRVPPLPKSLQEHIGKFLGEEMGIVGYWFGNLSVPGTVRAPIGPWAFDMSVDRSTQEDQVELEITVVRETPGDPDKTWAILSNSIRGHITKPVIIGYNRDNRGVQTMGALVIVPEVSPR